jgi:hypothetical protein
MQQVHKVVLCSSMESLTARATRECDNFMSERKHCSIQSKSNHNSREKNYRKLETVNVSIN